MVKMSTLHFLDTLFSLFWTFFFYMSHVSKEQVRWVHQEHKLLFFKEKQFFFQTSFFFRTVEEPEGTLSKQHLLKLRSKNIFDFEEFTLPSIIVSLAVAAVSHAGSFYYEQVVSFSFWKQGVAFSDFDSFCLRNVQLASLEFQGSWELKKSTTYVDVQNKSFSVNYCLSKLYLGLNIRTTFCIFYQTFTSARWGCV